MSNRFILILLCLFMALHVECVSKDNAISNVPTIYVNANNAVDSTLYDVCDSVIIIPLEDTNIYVGSQASEQIMVSDEYIFVTYDNRTKIDLFDMNGKKHHTLDLVGRGPGEYLRIHKIFYCNMTNELYLLSGVDKKVLTYRIPDFTFIRETEYSEYVRGFWKFDSLSSIGLFYEEGNFEYKFIRNLPLKEQFVSTNPISKMWIDEGYGVSLSDTMLLFVDQNTEPTLNGINSDTLIPLCKINYGNRAFDNKEAFWGDDFSYIYKFTSRFQLDNAVGLMLLPSISDDRVSFMYANGSINLNSLQYAVYDRKSHDVNIYSSLRFKNIPNNIYPYSVYGDFFVTLIVPENFVPQNTNDLDKAGEYINSELNRVANTPEAICTPFIMLYRLRSN